MAKILLVCEGAGNLLARRLESAGHATVVADGARAIELARNEAPGVVLMDLGLQNASGATVAWQFKAAAETRSIPLIALSDGIGDELQKAMDAGCDDYCTKPVDFVRLLAKIDASVKPAASTAAVDGWAVVSAYEGGRSGPKVSSTAGLFGGAARPAEDVYAEDDEVARAPAPPNRLPRDAVADGNGKPQDDRPRLLVVDDTESSVDLAARWLRREGCDVATALDATAALDLLARQDFDAVLLDVMMPGINGFELLQTIRATHGPADLPVIMATAKDGSDDVVEAFRLGANDYVTKPMDFAVLMARVKTQVALKRAFGRILRLERRIEQRNAELRRANQRMRSDLAAAAKVQLALLPTAAPNVHGYQFGWLFRPSTLLAGDLLNVFSLDEDNIGVYVLDVCGHGVAAALLSASVSRFLSPAPNRTSLLWRSTGSVSPTGGPSPADFSLAPPAHVAEALSRRFPLDPATGQFFTMVYGILDVRAHELRYVSAGHPNIIRVSAADGRATVIPASGYPIGVGPDTPYDEYRASLDPGDRLYLYSDGINEALSPTGELFGMDRLVGALQEAIGLTLDESMTFISRRLDEWSGSPAGADDISLMVIERTRT